MDEEEMERKYKDYTDKKLRSLLVKGNETKKRIANQELEDREKRREDEKHTQKQELAKKSVEAQETGNKIAKEALKKSNQANIIAREAVTTATTANTIAKRAGFVAIAAVLIAIVNLYFYNERNVVSKNTYRAATFPVVTMEYNSKSHLLEVNNKGGTLITLWGHKLENKTPKQHFNESLIPSHETGLVGIKELSERVNDAENSIPAYAIEKKLKKFRAKIPYELYLTDIDDKEYIARGALYVELVNNEVGVGTRILSRIISVTEDAWPEEISQDYKPTPLPVVSMKIIKPEHQMGVSQEYLP